jgi:hypothetical protein
VSQVEVHFPERVPVLVATVELDGRQVTVVSAHPLPPIDEGMAAMRDEMLAELGQRLALRLGPSCASGNHVAPGIRSPFATTTRPRVRDRTSQKSHKSPQKASLSRIDQS